MEAVHIPAGGGEVVGDAADRRVEILSDDERLNATWSRFGARREGADLHGHREHTDCFYVLEGELTVRLGLEDDAVTAPAGTLVRVPPDVVHGFRNASDRELRYLNLHAPGRRFADYLRAMRDGRAFSYDQHDPPDDPSPASDAVIGGVVHDADTTRLLADVDELAVAEVRGEPGTPAPPRHVHRRHVESHYVLEGELTFEVDGGELRAERGDWVQIPPGVVHTAMFTGDELTRVLVLHTPNCGFGAYVRGDQSAFDVELA